MIDMTKMPANPNYLPWVNKPATTTAKTTTSKVGVPSGETVTPIGSTGTTTTGWEGIMNPDYSKIYSGYGQPAANFPYPSQWGTSSNILSQMAQTGMPTSYAPWYEKAKGVVATDVQDAIKQAIEQSMAGQYGKRYSSPLAWQIGDLTSRAYQNLGAQYTGQELGAMEAARGRQMQAAGGYLPSLGQQYLSAPQDWAQLLYGMGSGMTGLQNQMANQYQAEFGRLSPEASPWWQLGMGATQMPGMMAPQQYQPSGMSQLLGGAGSLLSLMPFLFPSKYF
jgi:hypothetical protein